MTIAAWLVIRGAEGMAEPLSQLRIRPLAFDPWNLPAYALRTTLRMFAALFSIRRSARWPTASMRL